jgi:nucleotide-binding universal stress UspA family protein
MSTTRKVIETAVGAAVGAAIAGPAGAVAGGLVGSQASAHTPHAAESKNAPGETQSEAEDPIVHAQLQRILVPLDFSPASRRAVRFAREWAGRFGSEIVLLHVIEPINAVAAFGPDPIVPLLPMGELRDQARAEIEKIAREELPEPAKVSVQLRDGTPFDQIAIAARELGVDLIIIATHGRTGLAHVLMGSTAERVVRHAPCPVLTLRRTVAS